VIVCWARPSKCLYDCLCHVLANYLYYSKVVKFLIYIADGLWLCSLFQVCHDWFTYLSIAKIERYLIVNWDILLWMETLSKIYCCRKSTVVAITCRHFSFGGTDVLQSSSFNTKRVVNHICKRSSQLSVPSHLLFDQRSKLESHWSPKRNSGPDRA
jgi:hypothetical protein